MCDETSPYQQSGDVISGHTRKVSVTPIVTKHLPIYFSFKRYTSQILYLEEVEIPTLTICQTIRI